MKAGISSVLIAGLLAIVLGVEKAAAEITFEHPQTVDAGGSMTVKLHGRPNSNSCVYNPIRQRGHPFGSVEKIVAHCDGMDSLTTWWPKDVDHPKEEVNLDWNPDIKFQLTGFIGPAKNCYFKLYVNQCFDETAKTKFDVVVPTVATTTTTAESASIETTANEAATTTTTTTTTTSQATQAASSTYAPSIPDGWTGANTGDFRFVMVGGSKKLIYDCRVPNSERQDVTGSIAGWNTNESYEVQSQMCMAANNGYCYDTTQTDSPWCYQGKVCLNNENCTQSQKVVQRRST